MIAQFFEPQVEEGQIDRYLSLAGYLKPSLDAMGGCLFLERFKSLNRRNVLLSYQIWQDEGSMIAWRVDAKHHTVQETGRHHVFANYRIRIAQIIHEARPKKAVWRPDRISPYNDPQRRPPTFVVASESRDEKLPVKTSWRGDVFESIYRPGVFVHLVDVASCEEGVAFGEQLFADSSMEYFRVLEVMRDYGMFDRKEAPQYYPPVPTRG